jgi:NAD-dependent deacetylase
VTKPRLNPKKIVALTGAGISAPSGLATFRSHGGLWEQHRIEDVATPEAWARSPETVLRFYNARREALASVMPNEAHRSLAELQQKFEVVIITQNVDDLHERAGSGYVVHLHGELCKARSSIDENTVMQIGYAPLHVGDLCPKGGQLRPHIVWFGEEVMKMEEARRHIEEASRFLVVGTSLSVFPAAGLVRHARFHAEKIIVDLDPPSPPYGFRLMRGSADVVLPGLARRWLGTEESA